MTKGERAVLKAVRAAVRYFEEDGKTTADGWPDDTGLFITRADPGDEDFTLGDLRAFVAVNRGKR